MLKDQRLVQHALRMTLVSDSQSLQFRLPPPGVGVAQPRSSAAIAGGTPVVDALVLSSVWVVQVLRGLCQVRFCAGKWQNAVVGSGTGKMLRKIASG